MHLKKLPTYFTKGDQRKAVYHTVQARELQAAGWTQEGEEQVAVAKEAVAVPTPVAVQEEPPSIEVDPQKPEAGNLDEMTRAELVAFAEKNEIEFKSYASKAEILEACKEFVDG